MGPTALQIRSNDSLGDARAKKNKEKRTRRKVTVWGPSPLRKTHGKAGEETYETRGRSLPMNRKADAK